MCIEDSFEGRIGIASRNNQDSTQRDRFGSNYQKDSTRLEGTGIYCCAHSPRSY